MKSRLDRLIFSIFPLFARVFWINCLFRFAPTGFDRFNDSYYFLKHQIIFGLIPGLALLFTMNKIPYVFWRRHAWNLLIISLALLVLVFIPGLSAGIGNANSWISIGGWFSLQPSEIVKLTFLFYLAAWLASRDERGVSDIKSGFVPFLAVLGAIMLLMILQPDIGTMSIIAGMSLVVYFIGGPACLYCWSCSGWIFLPSSLMSAAPSCGSPDNIFASGLIHKESAITSIRASLWFRRA